MKKKHNITCLLKVVGWLMVGVGGIIADWARDRETREQNDKNFEQYISEKEES